MNCRSALTGLSLATLTWLAACQAVDTPNPKEVHGQTPIEQVASSPIAPGTMVSIVVTATGTIPCAGVLIGPREVITPASCLMPFTATFSGQNHAFTANPGGPLSESLIVHPGFSPGITHGTDHNSVDLAVLVFSAPIPGGSTPVPLSQQVVTGSTLLTGYRVTALYETIDAFFNPDPNPGAVAFLKQSSFAPLAQPWMYSASMTLNTTTPDSELLVPGSAFVVPNPTTGQFELQGIATRSADPDGGAPQLNEQQARFLNVQPFAYWIAEVLALAEQGATPQRTATSFYADVLGRTPDPQAFASWLQGLENGVPVFDIAMGFTTSLESYQNLAEELYQRYLRRQSDAPGKAGFVAQLKAGGQIDAVEAEILGSSEYQSLQAVPTEQGTPDECFIKKIYEDALGRIAGSAEIGPWVQELDGGATRTQVAAAILASEEYRQRLVGDWYLRYLRRLPNPDEQAGWAQVLNSGASRETVEAQILSSAEYQGMHL